MAELDFLDCIANELIRATTLNSGQVFVNKQPATPDDCVALFGLPGTVVSAQRDIPALQFPRFQAVVRAKEYNDAADWFQLVRTALHGKIGLVLPNGVNTATTPYIKIKRCHVEIEGGPLGEDDQGRSEFSCNFLAEYHHYDPTA